MKKYIASSIGHIGKLAILILMLSANTTSSWVAHQPKIPKGVRIYKK